MSERVGSEAPKGNGEHFQMVHAAVRAGDVFRPVCREVAAASPDELEAALRDFALDFTTKAAGFPTRAAWDTGEGGLQWMPVRRSDKDDPRWSSWIERRGGKGCEHDDPYDRTLVLIACIAFADTSGPGAPFIAYGLGGIRVLLHVDAPRDGKHLVRITAAISTVPRVVLSVQRRRKLIADVTIADLRSPELSIPGFNLMLLLDPRAGRSTRPATCRRRRTTARCNARSTGRSPAPTARWPGRRCAASLCALARRLRARSCGAIRRPGSARCAISGRKTGHAIRARSRTLPSTTIHASTSRPRSS